MLPINEGVIECLTPTDLATILNNAALSARLRASEYMIATSYTPGPEISTVRFQNVQIYMNHIPVSVWNPSIGTLN